MRLKRVRIFGFKTFADRTEVNLDGGIVAVVGPNGCGKSNLVDAILWALGESNARHLRAAASQDVIFSGSARRRPLGFAEVTLLFDNEDGSLPIDTSEVAVTRRLNRGGESDYLINHRVCRQRDVHELLADSGLGRAGYSIVSQKEIDQALAASPEDRRAWVDEAAGVQRYRLRKAESVKRLDSAREHLVRVEDIIRELDAQREPLREEAEIARKYRSAADALREVETGLLIRDLAKAVREVTELERRLSSSVAIVRMEHEKAEALDHGADQTRLQIEEIENRMEGIRSRLNDSIGAKERADSGARLGEERLRSLDQLEETLLGGDTEQAVVRAEAELEACLQEEKGEEGALATAREEVGGVGEAAKVLSERLKAAELALGEARRAEALRLKRQAEFDHRRERRAMAVRELQGIDLDMPNLVKVRDEASLEVEAALKRFAEAEDSLKQCEMALSELRLEEDSLGNQSRGLLAERAALEGRKRGIEATIHTHEGLAQGSRAVLEAAERHQISGLFVPVGQAIRTSQAHALAIETALGSAVNDLIVEDESVAKAAIQFLKERKLGRATFQPISLMHRDVCSRAGDLTSQAGIVGWAGDLVDCEAAHRPVIDSLLGRVLIVQELDTALLLAATPGWNLIVTLEGEVVHSSGAVAGGQTAKQHSGLVQRKADLLQIDEDLTALIGRIAALAEMLAQAGTRRQVLLSDSAAAKSALAACGGELNEARDYFRALASEAQATEKSREKLTREIGNLAQEEELPEAVDVDTLQRGRDDLINAFAARSADAEQSKRRLTECETRLQQARSRSAATSKRLDAARHSESQRIARMQNLEPERHRVRLEIERHRREGAEATDRRKQFEVDLQEAQGEKDSQLKEGLRLSDEAKTVRANIAAIGEANHQAELSRARAEARRATAAERLIEEYGIGENEAIEQESSVEVPADAQIIANRLRREIRAMGDVNVGAIEAYERLASRHDDLSAQRTDILEGVEQVLASMVELDKLTRDRFLDTFTRVEAAYSEVFHKLFGGGEGKVFLDNPNSVLESGIGIEVTLPGKKRQRLELLSGGERALCATAFLFALLQVKPSPLVVLDEVDAPLDGRNVERFGELLQEFTDRTQFIVITHNPTTIERAPVWLGVTMQEPGVTTLVPARLPVAAVVRAQPVLALDPVG